MIYHLNCGYMQPKLLQFKSVIYVLLVETNLGWTLVDSGLGKKDYTNPGRRNHNLQRLLGIPNDPQCSVIAQIDQMRINPKDIRHIVLTHLHFDHAGGLSDFPWARVHVSTAEFNAAIYGRGKLAIGYLSEQWAHRPYWSLYEDMDVTWYGFPAHRLVGFEPEMYMIPTPGHSAGHCMVAIRTDQTWLLQCGSATYPFYLSDQEINELPPNWLSRWINGSHVQELKKLYRNHGNEINFITAHDPVSLRKNKNL